MINLFCNSTHCNEYARKGKKTCADHAAQPKKRARKSGLRGQGKGGRFIVGPVATFEDFERLEAERGNP